MQWSSARGLRQTPLHDRWQNDNPHFAQVFDWERPLYFNKKDEPSLTFGKPSWFDQVKREVGLAHQGAAIFDQSTFGKIDVRGRAAATFLDRICANNMDRPPGRAIYTQMLNERGGIESDLTAVRLQHDHYRLYVGTTAVRRDLAWLQRHLRDEAVTLEDATHEYAVIGLMGPRSGAVAAGVGADKVKELGYFRAASTEIAGRPVTAVRLSYVGEAGWEITCRSADAGQIYDALFQQGARPAGSLAQTSMRIEKRFLAYGHDLDTDMTPLDAGLDFAVAWETDFIGRAALMTQRERSACNRIVTVILEDRGAVPLGNEPVYVGGKIAGKTTSAAFGYRLDRPLAIADMSDPEARVANAAVEIDIAGERFAGRVVTGAAFDPKGDRMRR